MEANVWLIQILECNDFYIGRLVQAPQTSLLRLNCICYVFNTNELQIRLITSGFDRWKF